MGALCRRDREGLRKGSGSDLVERKGSGSDLVERSLTPLTPVVTAFAHFSRTLLTQISHADLTLSRMWAFVGTDVRLCIV